MRPEPKVAEVKRVLPADRATPGVPAASAPLGPSARALAFGLLLALPFALGGCHREPESATPAAAPSASRATSSSGAAVDPAVAEATRTMAAAVTVGARTAPVEARYDLPAAPVAGQAFKLDIAVLPQAASPLVRVELRADEGLTLLDPVAAQSLERVQAGVVLHVPVTARASVPGTHVIDVGVTLELPTGPETRAFAVPVIVAGTAGK
jgi:hypothetical protein